MNSAWKEDKPFSPCTVADARTATSPEPGSLAFTLASDSFLTKSCAEPSQNGVFPAIVITFPRSEYATLSIDPDDEAEVTSCSSPLEAPESAEALQPVTIASDRKQPSPIFATNEPDLPTNVVERIMILIPPKFVEREIQTDMSSVTLEL